jgi:hypothetical protein
LVTRADADESVIYPPRSAKLVFMIPMDKMKCTDDGTYVCDMYVSINTVLNESSAIKGYYIGPYPVMVIT